MKPEILLKVYVQYQSEDAFRDLVAGTLDEVYSTALRLVEGVPHLAEEVVLRVYLELSRKARRLGKDVVVATWLRECTCRVAVTVLQEKDRAVNRAALKEARSGLSSEISVQPAPPGLAVCVCQGISMSPARHKGLGILSPGLWWPAWIRPLHVGGVALCVLVIVVFWNNPFHRRTPIVRSPELQLTPSSFAQLASPEEGWTPSEQSHLATVKARTNSNQK